MRTARTDPAPANGLVTDLAFVHPGEALNAITRTHAPSRLDVVGCGKEFDFQMQMARVPGLAFGRTRFGTDVRMTAIAP